VITDAAGDARRMAPVATGPGVRNYGSISAFYSWIGARVTVRVAAEAGCFALQ